MVSDGHLFCICDSISCPQSIAGISPLPRDQSHLWEGVQFSSVAQSCPTLCDPMNRSTPGLHAVTNSQSSLKLTSIKLVMPSGHLILCHPLFLLPQSLPASEAFPIFVKYVEQRSNCQYPLDHRESNRITEKYLLMLHQLC